MRRTVLAAVDNSAACRPVLAMASALAATLAASTEAVHVEEDLGETARANAELLGVPLRMLSGDPRGEIAALAAEDRVVAVVLGARGRPRAPRPAGHLAVALADAVDKPLVVVPPDARPPQRVHRVLVAMEGEPGRARSVRRAIDLAAAGADVDLIVVHVDDENSIPRFSDQLQHETDAYATEFLARCCPGARVAGLELRIGDPADEILSTARDVAPDLVAVGWPWRRRPPGGSVVREVLDRSPFPVLLVAVEAVEVPAAPAAYAAP